MAEAKIPKYLKSHPTYDYLDVYAKRYLKAMFKGKYNISRRWIKKCVTEALGREPTKLEMFRFILFAGLLTKLFILKYKKWFDEKRIVVKRGHIKFMLELLNEMFPEREYQKIIFYFEKDLATIGKMYKLRPKVRKNAKT